MSDFNEYAAQLNELAVNVRSEIATHEAAIDTAKREHEKLRITGAYGADYTSKALRAEANYMDKKTEYEAFMRDLPFSVESKVDDIRKALEKAIENTYSAIPEKLDSSTIQLLQSGILKPSEYERLFVRAEEESNFTMMRIIANHIEKERG